MLHQVIREHLESFLCRAAAAGEGAGLPQFVEREFREFLTCGAFEGGVARFQCEGCACEHLVPFFCKGRGFCPSCGGRRMTERAAHLVDEVLPQVPVRQWVLTVPYRLRYQMAWDHALSRAVLGVYARVVLDLYARGARERGSRDGRTGMVTVIQRAASGLNLNVHFHMLVLDGVFSEAPGGALEFHPAPAPRDDEVAEVLATVRHRVQRQLVRRGLEPGDEAAGADERDVAGAAALPSSQGRDRRGSQRAGLGADGRALPTVTAARAGRAPLGPLAAGTILGTAIGGRTGDPSPERDQQRGGEHRHAAQQPTLRTVFRRSPPGRRLFARRRHSAAPCRPPGTR